MWEVDGQVEHLAPRGVRGLTTLGEGNNLSTKTLRRRWRIGVILATYTALAQ
jgi:hypothetical protein